MQLVGRKLPIINARDYVLEILARRIATAEKRHFPLVEFRIGERDVLFHHADEHVGATVCNEFEPCFDCHCVTGCIDHDIKEFAIRKAGQSLFCIGANDSSLCESKFVAGFANTRLIGVQNSDLCTFQPRNQRRTKAYRADPDDQHPLPRLHGGTPHTVGADSKELHHCTLVGCQASCRVKRRLGHQHKLAHATVIMDTKHADAGTTIKLATPARDA